MFNPLAEEAYSQQNSSLSILAHQSPVVEVESGHSKEANKYVRCAVNGGIYGVMAALIPIAAGVGADLNGRLALLFGLVGVVAGAFSFSIGEYVTNKSRLKFVTDQRAREMWEMDNFAEGEKREMVEIYMSRGFSAEEATQVIEILSSHKEFFVDHMMVYELEIMPPDSKELPSLQAIFTLLAFLVSGFLVLIPALARPSEQRMPFGASCGVGAVLISALGVVKCQFGARSYFPGAMLSVFHGVAGVVVSFLVGIVVARTVDLSSFS